MRRSTGRRGWLGVALGAAAALLVAVPALGEGSAKDEAAQLASCGEPGQAPCPLQGFMRASIARPLASNDKEALAAALTRAARFAPDASWTSWSSFAAEGAAAARAGDIPKARTACKGCHDAWRPSYRASFRARPLPSDR